MSSRAASKADTPGKARSMKAGTPPVALAFHAGVRGFVSASKACLWRADGQGSMGSAQPRAPAPVPP